MVRVPSDCPPTDNQTNKCFFETTKRINSLFRNIYQVGCPSKEQSNLLKLKARHTAKGMRTTATSAATWSFLDFAPHMPDGTTQLLTCLDRVYIHHRINNCWFTEFVRVVSDWLYMNTALHWFRFQGFGGELVNAGLPNLVDRCMHNPITVPQLRRITTFINKPTSTRTTGDKPNMSSWHFRPF